MHRLHHIDINMSRQRIHEVLEEQTVPQAVFPSQSPAGGHVQSPGIQPLPCPDHEPGSLSDAQTWSQTLQVIHNGHMHL